MNKMIPIFIITYDRLRVLKESIQSYHDCIKTPFEIVVVDFGSTYGPTIEYLKNLEQEKVKVYWKDRIHHKDGLNSISGIVQDYFRDHLASNYVVTDPDIALDNVEGDVLEVYANLLKNLPKITVVGPMLRIDDIPDHYPKKQKLISKSLHVDFHSRPVSTIKYDDKIIRYIFALIDTTFAMNRAGTPWRRWRQGVRVLRPYSARHLDWYLDPNDLTPDQTHYKENASRRIVHWSVE